MKDGASPRQAPDRAAALAQYRRRAQIYDFELAFFEPIRRQAIAALALRHGDTVLDAGCGTGLSFALLEHAIGSKGRIVGIEQCPEMLAQARRRAACEHWRNIVLLESPVESAPIAQTADAALFHFTHDILQQPAALTNVFGHLKPGARVVAAGLKWTVPWAVPVNLFVLGAALYSVTSLSGLDQPWRHLDRLLDDLTVDPTLWGGGFVVSGVVPRKPR